MPLIEPLPKAALGVIIVVAALGLIDLRGMWRLRHVRDAEVGLALSAFAGVLLFGVLGGVAVAIALSVGVFLYRAARPHDAVLGAVDDIDGYHDIERFTDAQTVPGLLIYRFDAPPFFVNAEYLRQRVLELVASSSGVEWVVMNAEAWMFLDATAVDAMKQLQSDLEEIGGDALLRTTESQAARDLRRNRLDSPGRRLAVLPDRPVRRHRLRTSRAERRSRPDRRRCLRRQGAGWC